MYSVAMNAFDVPPTQAPVTFWQLYKPHRGNLAIGLVYLLATNFIAIILPRLINNGVALVEGTKNAGIFTSVAQVVSILVVLAVLGAITRTLSRTAIFNVGRLVERDLRQSLFAHLSTLSFDFYRKKSTGDLMSHLTNDVTNVRLFTGFAVLNIFNLIIIFTATVPVLLAIDFRVALAALLPFPLVTLLHRVATGRMMQRSRVYQESVSDVANHVQENLSAAQVIRVFHQEEAEKRRFSQTNDSNFAAAMRLCQMRVVMFPLQRLMAGLGVAMTLFIGGRAVVLGHMTVGDFVEVNVRLMQLTWPAISLGFVLSIYNRGKASLVRINELLVQQPLLMDGDFSGEVDGSIWANHLTVHYGEDPALQEISFRFPKRSVVGVVGPSGSGKSALVRALARETALPRGQLSYGDRDINDFNLLAFHRQVAVVPQEAYLFSTSLRDNITFARPDATDAEVNKVIEQVGLAREVAIFPDGLSTIIGERGVTLSGGQRQRVALARAILAQPKVLILDDCLSAIDAETEAHIVAQLRHANLAPTLVIISHRLSAVMRADAIFVLDKGKIVANGHHDALLKTSSLYRALWGKEQVEQALEATHA